MSVSNSPLRIALNGYGRIGRCVLRALAENPRPVQIVAINEPADLQAMAYLTRFDSTHGPFRGVVETTAAGLRIDGQDIPVFHAPDAKDLPWDTLRPDLMLECSGRYTTRAQLQALLDAGCPRILLSNPARSAADVDATIVMGVNDAQLNAEQRIVSAASCTTGASVPILDALSHSFGVESAFLTTLHAAMNDQPLIDGYHHPALAHMRAALLSMVPISTGLAAGVERLIPALSGRVQAKHIRVPIANVSAIDMVVQLRQAVTLDALTALLHDTAQRLPESIRCTREPHASIDFNHSPHSAILDLTQTRVNAQGGASLLIWFDNEWGFTCRLLDVACAWAAQFLPPTRTASARRTDTFLSGA